jgi:pimeloyl-ACP methyl ester carboxylesterase
MTFVEVLGKRLEYLDLPGKSPELFLLHEGVGSVSMWRDFPAALNATTGCRIIAYSREGHGRSSPRNGPFEPSFMHAEALETMPAIRTALAIERTVLIGHSTGGSMALIHAGANRWPVAGVIAMAPLTFVEESNLATIREARNLYQTTRWRDKLGRHHTDVDHAFFGWNDIWLHPGFRSWNIAADIRGIRCPILAILGEGDPYATPAQVEVIEKNAAGAASFEFLRLAECGHEPHKDQPERVMQAVRDFVEQVSGKR